MKSSQFVAAALVIACVAAVSDARADSLAVVNQLRTKGCSGHLAAKQHLNTNANLAVAARHVKEGMAVREALKRAAYRADQSAIIHISGTITDESLRRVLAKNYCATLIDATLTELGIFSDERNVAMVFAAPFAPPSPGDASKVGNEVLQRVNEARARPRRCGSQKFKAVARLVFNDRLLVAATAHAKDMAKRGLVAHEGADGSSPGDRATRAGYGWMSVGENVAGGQLTAKEVVDGWLSSPHHCVNIMDAGFTQMAVAYVINTHQEIGIYWAQEFGRPQ